ncbi:rabgap/tbc domain-containing protein [Anaeramoeba ignava]|uniref:Rabgap/tbc domain-containing protein n=1 Tax=Anaeramoeba ignava TaxID=1746090 RepID=A0A9Q0LRN5_ANAIG|nr:rabgap/tbc domain-containing protein [Anaeramoeba ignava]
MTNEYWFEEKDVFLEISSNTSTKKFLPGVLRLSTDSRDQTVLSWVQLIGRTQQEETNENNKTNQKLESDWCVVDNPNGLQKSNILNIPESIPEKKSKNNGNSHENIANKDINSHNKELNHIPDYLPRSDPYIADRSFSLQVSRFEMIKIFENRSEGYSINFCTENKEEFHLFFLLGEPNTLLEAILKDNPQLEKSHKDSNDPNSPKIYSKISTEKPLKTKSTLQNIWSSVKKYSKKQVEVLQQQFKATNEEEEFQKQIISQDESRLENLNLEIRNIKTIGTRGNMAVNEEIWKGFLDENGRVKNPTQLQKIIFYNGIDPKMRQLIWKFLLGYFPMESTEEEREEIQKTKKRLYQQVKTQWENIIPEQEKNFRKYRQRKTQIEKDVYRTDRVIGIFSEDNSPSMMMMRDILLTYSFYNFDLGFVQGMADLLTPIISVMQNEEDSFWCFVGLMKRVETYFLKNQPGLREDMLILRSLLKLLDPEIYNIFVSDRRSSEFIFCFRWLLVCFKREFAFNEIPLLWEVVWTDFLSDKFHLFIAVAILQVNHDYFIAKYQDFDSILDFLNNLSGRLDLVSLLNNAELLVQNYTQKIPLVFEKAKNKLITLENVSSPNIDSDKNRIDNLPQKSHDKSNNEKVLKRSTSQPERNSNKIVGISKLYHV